MSMARATSDDNKAMESETPPVSSSSSSSSGEGGGRPKTGLVATYLRDWRSSLRVDTLEQKTATNGETVKKADTGDGNQVMEVTEEKERGPVEVEAEPDDNQENREEKKEFEATYHCLPDVEEGGEESSELLTSEERGRRPMQYLDVLLQTDEHGVGLDVGLGEEEGRSVLVVQSFRRLSEADVGPAEACGKIKVGDILHAVDGEEVASFQQLHSNLAGRLGRKRKFVLLRFLRPVGDALEVTPFACKRTRSPDTNGTRWSEVDALLRTNPQVATLVRQLATTNQLLQDQLIDSRLKQEEQNIQLDQLHALYARTQAEGLPLFSLSKSIRPFSRKPSSADVTSGNPMPTKIQTEVLDAVNAEYARLRQEFQLQHVLDRRELERKYAEKVKQLEEATAKKVKMLEFGFQEALGHYANDHNCSCRCQALKDLPLNTSQQCRAAEMNLKSTEYARKDPSCEKLGRIMNLLAEYDEMKRMRTAMLQVLGPVVRPAPVSELKTQM